jgi:hypothetical protein
MFPADTIELPPELIAEIRTGPARRGFLSKFERDVDPEGRLPAPERARLARIAMREHMARLGRSSGRSRREQREAAVHVA